MATFISGFNQQVGYAAIKLDTLDGDWLYEAGATRWRAGPTSFQSGNDVQIDGIGLTYTAGKPTGGTIQAISTHDNGAVGFELTDISLSAATFHALQLANDNTGFANAVFGGSDSITGSNLDDQLNGLAGNDTIAGLGGDDTIDGGTGADTMLGGTGDDHYYVDNAGDTISDTGGDSNDGIFSTISIDLTKAAYAGVEHVELFGVANLNANGDAGENFVTGNAGNNTLKGGDGDDSVLGQAGNDKLDGEAGNDVMRGGAGNDSYTVDSPLDMVDETDGAGGPDEGGTDTVYSSAITYLLAAHVENLVLTGAASDGYGNGIANKITGNDHDNVLNGAGGADTLTGGKGNDYYLVDDVSDKVVETGTGGTADRVQSTVTFTLAGNVEDLLLAGGGAIDGTGNLSVNHIWGNGAANTIDGKGGNDELSGGAGNDTLIGGAGDDLLRGGSGNDTLDVSQGNDTVFYAGKLDGHDVIVGFDGNAAGGQDVLDLDGYLDALGVAAGDRAGRVFASDEGATVAIWIDTDGNNKLDTVIVTINTTESVTVGQDVLLGT